MLYCYTNTFHGLSGEESQHKGLRYQNVGKMAVKEKETQELYQCTGVILMIHVISCENNRKISGNWNIKWKKNPPGIQDVSGQIQPQNMGNFRFLCLVAEIILSVFQLLITFCLLINTPKLSSREKGVYWEESKSMPMDISFFYHVQVFFTL